jgi:hypothetical protein
MGDAQPHPPPPQSLDGNGVAGGFDFQASNPVLAHIWRQTTVEARVQLGGSAVWCGKPCKRWILYFGKRRITYPWHLGLAFDSL